jgi:predicted secreted protein
MKAGDGKGLRMAAVLCAGLALLASPAIRAATNVPALSRPTPPAPPPRWPIGFFRELLAMSATERKQALTNHPPAAQTVILAKVREYESLPADERELRLRVTELQSYLRPLMSARDTNRAVQLARIPEADRKLVEDRLREWDKLTPEAQKDLMEHEATLLYLAQIEGRSEEQRRLILTNIPPGRRELLERGIAQWEAMSEEQRRKVLGRFNRFFELSEPEKEKALKTLSEAERRQIEKTLRAFDRLRPDQRSECMRSFAKFASLSVAERQEFLKNAERWEQMSPNERQAWRELVRKMPPPLPPRRAPKPPQPPSVPASRPTPAVVTNGN